MFGDIAPEVVVEGSVHLTEEDIANGAERKTMLRTGKGRTVYVYDGDGTAWLDVSRLEEGERGNAVYAAATNYAHNASRIFIGDPAGLSDIALRRRTEAMLASALKFSTTRHLEPHSRQLEGDSTLGVPPLRWTEGDDLGNIQSLIDASIASLNSAVPEIRDARYDFETRTFRDAQGQPLSDEAFDRWRMATSRAGKAGAGNATLRRGILLNTLSCSESSERPGLLEQALRVGGNLVASGGLTAILY